jgi:hypothetical protein
MHIAGITSGMQRARILITYSKEATNKYQKSQAIAKLDHHIYISANRPPSSPTSSRAKGQYVVVDPMNRGRAKRYRNAEIGVELIYTGS